jgi:hypothetical protein
MNNVDACEIVNFCSKISILNDYNWKSLRIILAKYIIGISILYTQVIELMQSLTLK